MKMIKTACSLDCWDQCAFLVGVENGKIASIGPDPDQPITAGSICVKGKKHLERFYHPHRLMNPLLKKAGSFTRVSWNEALHTMAEKISKSLNNHGPLSLLHFFDGGYGGLLKNIESRFFSALGGCTMHRGSLCWGAGLAAQRYDFGTIMSHHHEDLINSKLIVIWGRNPAYTQVHLLPYIRRASEKGAKVILIDPIRTATAGLADEHVRINPGTDGALALGMAGIIIESGIADFNFISSYTTGFEQYRELCADYTPDKTAEITGIPSEKIMKLALDYADHKPASLMIGFGVQRHSNGGNTIRAIDALAAVTGNIGIAGGGANYANFRTTRLIDHDYLGGVDLNPTHRIYSKPKLAETIMNLKDPEIDFLYISRSNPMVQIGDSELMRAALSKVPFVVTADHFMTDTAAASDLVLPAACFPEAEDIFFTSMSHQYLNYGPKIIDPPGECRVEYDYLKELADLLGVEGFPEADSSELLTRAIRPLTAALGITLEDIKEKSPLLLPGGNEIPWADRVFETADGKYNFYSEKAVNDGADGLPLYHEPIELSDQNIRGKGYRYWFATPHPRNSIHSIHRLNSADEIWAYISSETARFENLVDGEEVRVSSIRGNIELKVKISDNVPPETVMVYEGWWHNTGSVVNKLAPDRVTDIGDQAAYYDCLCRIDKKNMQVKA